MSRALTGGRQPWLKGRVIPLVLLVVPVQGRTVFIHGWQWIHIYTHIPHPSRAHTHTHGHRDAALSTVPFLYTGPNLNLTPNYRKVPNDLFVVWIKSLITGSRLFFNLFFLFQNILQITLCSKKNNFVGFFFFFLLPLSVCVTCSVVIPRVLWNLREKVLSCGNYVSSRSEILLLIKSWYSNSLHF